MQVPFLVYPSIKFFNQAIKKKIVSPSSFCGLGKPLACINHRLKKIQMKLKKNLLFYLISLIHYTIDFISKIFLLNYICEYKFNSSIDIC
jgi:hypothetical protein